MTTVILPRFRSTLRRSPPPLQPLALPPLSLLIAEPTTTKTTVARRVLFWVLAVVAPVVTMANPLAAMAKTGLVAVDKDKHNEARNLILSCIDFTTGSRTVEPVRYFCFFFGAAANKNATNLLTTTSQPALIVCSLFLCRIEPEKMGKVLEVDPHPPCRSPFYSPPRAFQFDPLRSAPL